MARLILKGKPDKGVFKNNFEATHKGKCFLSIEKQRKGMEFIMKKIMNMSEELKELGYDPTTIYVGISEEF